MTIQNKENNGDYFDVSCGPFRQEIFGCQCDFEREKNNECQAGKIAGECCNEVRVAGRVRQQRFDFWNVEGTFIDQVEGRDQQQGAGIARDLIREIDNASSSHGIGIL